MDDERKPVPSAVRWSVAGFAAYALLGGAVTLVGWFARVPRLTDWPDSGISMFANTALGAVCAGLALMLSILPRPWAMHLCRALGVVVATLGAATLFEHLSGINLGIDTLIVRDPWGEKAAVVPGRMGPPASTCFTLLGIGLLLLGGGWRARRIAPALGIAVSAIAMLSLIGYLFGAQPLFTLAQWTGIAFQTATILFALGLALVAVAFDLEPMRTFSEDSAAGVLARRSLPVVFALFIALGWLRVRGQRAAMFDTATGTAMLVLVGIILFCALLWWCVRMVAAREQALRQSEGRLASEANALTRLNELSSRLWQQRSLREGLDEMLAATIELLRADMGNIQILDANAPVLRIAVQRGFQQEFLDFFREVSTADESACGRALRSGVRTIIEDVEADAAYAPLRAVARAAGYRGVQSTPLIGLGGKALGMLSTHWHAPHRPSERDLRRLDLYVRQAADFIERHRADQALRENERAQRLLAQVGELGARLPGTDELIGAICERVGTELAVSRCGYTVVDISAGTLIVMRDYFGSPLRSLAGLYPFSPHRELYPDPSPGSVTANEDASLDPCTAGRYQELWAPLGLRAAVSVPLHREGQWAAVFWVGHHEPRRWTPAEIELVKLIADRVWVVVDRNRAEQALHCERERLKQAAEAVRHSEERLHGIISSAMDAVITIDSRQRIVLFNPAAESMFGLKAAEAEGKHIECLIPERFRSSHGKSVEAFGRTGVSNRKMGALGAISGVRANGEEFPIEASISQIKIGGERLFTVILRDITERKRAEDALRESEALLSAVLKQLPVGLGVMDIQGQWLVSNALMEKYVPTAIPSAHPERISRWRAYDAAGRLIPPEDWPGGRALRGEIVSPGLEMVFTTDEGQDRWMRVSAAPLRDSADKIVGATCLVQDIDVLKRAQESLRESEERYRSLVSVITDVPWTTDAEGAFVTVQEAWSAYTGQPWDQHRGFGWTDALHPEDRERVQAVWQRACETRSLYETEGRLWHAPTQGWRHFTVKGTPLFNEDGSVREWVGTCTDVHEQKTAEVALRENQLRLKLALEAAAASARTKDLFLASLSHELRTPLTPVLLTVAGLQRDASLSPAQRKSLEVIDRNVRIEAQMVNDLLDLSRIDYGKLDLALVPCNLHEIVRRALDMGTAGGAAKRVNTRLKLEAAEHVVNGDSARLQQVFWNLVQNASKFTPSGGTVTVSSRNENGRVVVTVADTGIGIEPEMLEKIFEPFAQEKRGGEGALRGLGLGLAIARRIVTAHGGTLTAASEGANRGSVFTVKLPVPDHPARNE